MVYEPIPRETDRVAKAIVESAFAVHQALGPGLLEQVYEICFCHELSKHNLNFQRQVSVSIVYDGVKFDKKE